jgi:hypothetical protein
MKAKANEPHAKQLIEDLDVIANSRFDFTTSISPSALRRRKHPPVQRADQHRACEAAPVDQKIHAVVNTKGLPVRLGEAHDNRFASNLNSPPSRYGSIFEFIAGFPRQRVIKVIARGCNENLVYNGQAWPRLFR